MAKTVVNGAGHRTIPWRALGWGMAALLLLPLVAMQFTDEVRWGGSDFVFAAAVFGGIGIAFQVVFRRNRQVAYRVAVAAALAASIVIVWANAAVGMIGDGLNVYNFMLLGVVGFAIVGAVRRLLAYGYQRRRCSDARRAEPQRMRRRLGAERQ